MHYLVGLGNPGEEYEHSRHNVGFLLVRAFVAAAGLPQLVSSSKFSGELSEGFYAGSELSCLLPTTYMNKSGSAVAKLVPKGEVSNLTVIYDDVDLPLGSFKVSVGRGSGGHNGIESIVASLGSKDFVRLRVGVSPKSFWTGQVKRPASHRLGDYVLGKFTRREEEIVTALVPQVTEAIAAIIEQGPEAAMNRFN